ncbi:Golgi SNAP receptor complex member 2-like [Sycon ciliatum]|uniref:Golgi SNAP receptor complex member 2-like n=1 Tax=Sycon ciliatum TaxID=27933 RepID=UPI0020AAAE96|eukprot:scpid63918/ scgid25384/ Golgi SNAP receptor complex member 2; 27 kDa Golgi SNARE protein; Membrin
MDDTLQRATRLLTHLQYQYSSILSGKAGGGADGDFPRDLEQLASMCDRLDTLLNKEPLARRQTCKARVDQIRFDYQTLARNYESHHRRLAAHERQTHEREELMARQFTRNSQETSLLLDSALRENTSLQSSTQGLDDLIGQGQSILSNLRDQRSILKNAQRKVLDVMTSLGLSNTVMRLIERRSSQDKLIMFGGMLAVLLFMFFFYRWYHS